MPGDELENYIRALGLTNQELGAKFGNSARQFSITLSINNWMRDYPLAR